MTDQELRDEIERLKALIRNAVTVLNVCCSRWNHDDPNAKVDSWEEGTRSAVAQITVNLTEGID